MTASALERTPLLGLSSTRGDHTQTQDHSAQHEQTADSPVGASDVLVEPTRQQLITVFVATWSAGAQVQTICDLVSIELADGVPNTLFPVFFGSMDLTIVAALVSPIGSRLVLSELHESLTQDIVLLLRILF